MTAGPAIHPHIGVAESYVNATIKLCRGGVLEARKVFAFASRCNALAASGGRIGEEGTGPDLGSCTSFCYFSGVSEYIAAYIRGVMM
jgi:hypothetical protein